MFLKYETSMRDPVHDYIPCTRLELDLIDTTVFQRLRRISQTPPSRFVYHGAEHTRFSHSLGVMHLAGKMADKILQTEKLGKDFYFLKGLRELSSKGRESFSEIKDLADKMFDVARKIQIVRIAGLLHDIGHVGFSHTLEPILERYQNLTHENMTIKILERNKEIRRVFKVSEEAKFLRIDIEDIIRFFKKQITEDQYLCEIISGTIDADKIDFILRDAHHTGTIEYGAIDSQRLTECLTVAGSALIPDSSAVDAVIDFWEARFHMFSAVYYHRAVRSMDIIIRNMVDQFLIEYKRLPKSQKPKTILSAFFKIADLHDYLLLDDYSIISELSRLTHAGSQFDLAFRFLEMYKKRKLLTLVDEYRPGPVEEETWKMLTDRRRLDAMRTEISKLSGVSRDFIFIDAPPEVEIRVNPVFGKCLMDMIVYDKKENKCRPIGEFDSKTVEALSTLRGLIRIYTVEQHEKKVREGYEKYKKRYLEKIQVSM